VLAAAIIIKLQKSMRQKTINLVIISVIILGFVAAIFSLVIKNKPATTQEETVATPANESAWKIYRDEENGFQIQYPADFLNENYLAVGEALKFPCGNQIGKSFRITKSKDSVVPAYQFTVFFNSQKLSPKDFFVCKTKNATMDLFDETLIKNIEAFRMGKQNMNATRIVLDGSVTVLVPDGNNIYEIRLEKNTGDGNDPNEFAQMLSSFSLSEAKKPSAIENKMKRFCADAAKNELGNGLLAFYLPLKSDTGNENEVFVGCAKRSNSSQTEWQTFENVLTYHLLKNKVGNYESVWSGGTGSDTAKDGTAALNWTYFTKALSAGDINGDGMNEVLLSGRQYEQKECTEYCYNWCLYAPAEKNIHCIANCQGWKKSSLVVAATAVKDCPIVKTLPKSAKDNCDSDTYLTTCFDNNGTGNSENKIFRDYLEKKSISTDSKEWPSEINSVQN